MEPATNLIIDETLNLKKYKYWKPDLNVENNLEYSKTLALRARKQNARFIYASSAATYGNGIKSDYIKNLISK